MVAFGPLCYIRDGPIRTVMGGRGGGVGEWEIFEPQECFFRYQIPCMNFFSAIAYFLGLIGVHDFFHLIFLYANIFFALRRPPPTPHKFSNRPPLSPRALIGREECLRESL